MKVIKKRLDDLKHPEKNVRIHSEQQIRELKRSLEKFGQTRALVVDENNVILIGNGLYEAMVSLGYQEASVYVKTELSENDKKKLMIADNKTYALGIDNLDTLNEFLEELQGDLDIPGYDEEILQQMVADADEVTEKISEYGTLDESEIQKIKEANEKREQKAAAAEISDNNSENSSENPNTSDKVYVQIDDTGLGGGVTDRLKEVRKEQKLYKMQIIPINAAEKIETDTAAGKEAAEKYNNLTTAMWASMRDLLDNKQIVIEDDEQTIGQLSSRKYTMTSNGKLEIESKKEMKKRGLDSPDRADALALALYLGKIKKHTGTAPGVKELQELTKDNYWG